MSDDSRLWRFTGARAAAGFVLLYLYVPIIVLVALSFTSSDSALSFGDGLSLRWYATVLADNNIMQSLRNSLIVASFATIAGTTISLMAALALVRHPFRGQRIVETSLGLPIIVPDIVSAIAMLLLFVLIGLPLGLVSLMLAHTVFAIPISYFPIRARLQGMDAALMEAASDLYARPWQIFRRIVLPLAWPGVLSGAMLAFIGSLGDVVVSYFVSGPGSTTLPVYVYSMVRMGITPAVNAISTLVIASSVGLLLISYLLSRRSFASS